MAKPLYMKKDLYGTQLEKAIEMIEDLDENKLGSAALNAPVSKVRESAVAKLTEQALLERVAVKDSDFAIRLAAVKKLTDQTTLAVIIKRESAPIVKKAAVNNITDQALLSDIAKTHSAVDIRMEALKKLTNQNDIASIAKNDLSTTVRKEAVNMLTDRIAIEKISRNDPSDTVRQAAEERLKDPAVPEETSENGSTADAPDAASVQTVAYVMDPETEKRINALYEETRNDNEKLKKTSSKNSPFRNMALVVGLFVIIITGVISLSKESKEPENPAEYYIGRWNASSFTLYTDNGLSVTLEEDWCESFDIFLNLSSNGRASYHILLPGSASEFVTDWNATWVLNQDSTVTIYSDTSEGRTAILTVEKFTSYSLWGYYKDEYPLRSYRFLRAD